jgi:hypothetical protein
MEPASGAPGSQSATSPSEPSSGSAPVDLGPWRCVADPSVETFLRCGRCEKPICPRCMIQTPVGARCRQCAQLRKLPMFELRPLDYLKAIGAALGASIVCGVVLALVLQMVPFLGFLRFFLMVGVGYVVGDAVTRLTGGKRGTVVGVIAGVSVPIGMILGLAALFIVGGAIPVLAITVAVASTLFQIWSLLGVVVAAAVAFTRAR